MSEGMRYLEGAFTHLALVNAVVHLIREEQKRARGLSTPHVVTT